MNNGAVITNEEKGQKSPLWGSFADFAILDVETMLTLPKKQVISGAFDTLSHAMETYLGSPRTPNLSDEMGEAVMKSVIRNLRRVVKDEKDVEARSELVWASSMAENGILKLGKVTDFQAHMIEHQLGAFTNCNHGAGLAVIHPALYRHLAKAAPQQFARLATEVFGVEAAGRSEEELALAMPEALAAFIQAIGMPTTLTELGITDDAILRKTAGAHFPVGNPNTRNRAVFTGDSFVAKVTDGSVPVYNVTFYNGAHTFWHIHHGTTQTLLAVSGVGCYQIWEQPMKLLLPGQSVTIPAEVKHWHGAAPGQTFQHISISEPNEGASNEWLEEVSQDDDQALLDG